MPPLKNTPKSTSTSVWRPTAVRNVLSNASSEGGCFGVSTISPAPVTLPSDLRALQNDQLAGRDLSDSRERRVRGGENAELQVFSQTALIETDGQAALCDQGGKFSREDDLVPVQGVKQVALPGAVPRQD